jgi:hypothetical protein
VTEPVNTQRRTRHPKRVIFAKTVDPDTELKRVTTTLRFEARPIHGGRLIVDLTSLGRPDLARRFAQAIWRACQIGGGIGSVWTLKAYVTSIKNFFKYLDAEYAQMNRVEKIDAAHIDNFERWLKAEGFSPILRHQSLSKIINCLRQMEQDAPGTLPSSTIERLNFISDEPYVRSRPRDAYSSRIATELRKAAHDDVLAIHKRLTVDRNTPPPDRATDDPEICKFYHAALAEIDNAGTMSYEHPCWKHLLVARRNIGLPRRHLTNELHGQRYLLASDIIPFVVFLGLNTGMEIECIKSLRSNCLKNPSKGYVEIEYRKLRARGAEWKRLRVRDGGSATPGGLIRLVLKLTENARRYVETDNLWVYFNSFASKLTV